MNEQTIWDFFYNKLKNPYGVAALMGNLYIESKLDPTAVSKNCPISAKEYTPAVDNGSYQSFVRDGFAYGLVQWRFWSRKEGLLDYAQRKKKSVGDLTTQMEYIWQEIQTYKTVFNSMKNATNIKEPSDLICERYEKPATQTAEAKAKRSDQGQKYYDMFVSPAVQAKNDAKTASKQVVVQTDRVNIRAGNGKNYPKLTMVNKGTSYNYVAETEDWYAIELKDKVGWVSKEFSKIG